MQRGIASTISAGTEPKRQGPITHLPSNPPSCAVSETTSIASPKSTPHSPRPESPSQAPISIDNAATTATTASTDDSHQPPSVFSSHIIVRDFAYADTHPLHHGPPPANSSASNRNTDDDKIDGTERGDTEGSRPAPDWNPDAMYDNTLPPTSYGDGPPYSEDEDLHSPILITTRRRKSKSDGRSPDGAGEFDNEKGIFVSDNGDGTETYYMPDDDAMDDGPGGEYVTYDDWQEDDSRLSRDFHFAITSPDEEMHGKAIALFDFQSMHENELPLREGQVILVSYRHGEGWLVAEDPKTGESGLVPEAYVRLARHIEGGLNSLNGEQGFENETSQQEEEVGDVDSQVLETPGSLNVDDLKKEMQGGTNDDIQEKEQGDGTAKGGDGSIEQGKRNSLSIDCSKETDKPTEQDANESAN